MLESIKKVWPNAHPEWVIVLRKSNGEEKTTYKGPPIKRYVIEGTIDTNKLGLVPTVQKVKVQCKFHRVS